MGTIELLMVFNRGAAMREDPEPAAQQGAVVNPDRLRTKADAWQWRAHRHADIKKAKCVSHFAENLKNRLRW